LCVGIYDNLVFNSTIDRNKHVIPGEVLAEIINGSQALFETLSSFGINIHYLGGETADVGDVVRTIAVNGTLTARWPKNKLITNERIKVGDVIVGLSSFGQATYESTYNSGIASNGLTSARHDMLNNHYAQHFPETFDPNTNKEVVYVGPYRLTDKVPIWYRGLQQDLSIGQLLLSPTRTFAPVVREILMRYNKAIHGMVHCSGGGQTKCLKYVPDGVSVVKDNLIEVPEVFHLIQKAGGADLREMYQVFNMGTRLEVYTSADVADEIINMATSYGIEAQIIGRVEAAEIKSVKIKTAEGTLTF
ncbi:MAG: AIR synthase-related protein, partial [Bacteroidota bacterium]